MVRWGPKSHGLLVYTQEQKEDLRSLPEKSKELMVHPDYRGNIQCVAGVGSIKSILFYPIKIQPHSA